MNVTLAIFFLLAQGKSSRADQVNDSPVDNNTADIGVDPKARDSDGNHDPIHDTPASKPQLHLSSLNSENNNSSSSRWNANTREIVSLSLAKDQKLLEERFARIRERELVIEEPGAELEQSTPQDDASGSASGNNEQLQASWNHHRHSLMAENVQEKVRAIERPE